MRKTTVALICLGLLAIAIGCMAIMIKTAPTAEKKSPPKMAALVDVLSLNAADETVVLHLTGTVVPNEE
ncbi:MAG: hypothetical protein K9M54_08790, partial [Kiritimatiellales bacterium]|nr:hypothetical protein [Kiritimatiellales bacterium]